ncbi:hypothetical protein PR001_g8208 [Phytophthora rubi]|uniref:FAR1 domain-containing protein n=1 Tax=Phytophthora rubi TaxID=129364 RepID=A0A6A3MXE5_9STRA|nr:hypothetical protein PR001_g8208 [Phytophthora rubi]
MVARRSPRGKTKRRLDTDDEEEEGYQGPQDGATSTSISVTAPAMEQASFDSWAEFQTSLERYQAETYQLYFGETAMNSTARNKRILENYKGDDESLPRTIPVKRFEHYNKLLRCTHYGRPRHRGSGERPRQKSRNVGCTARMSVCLQFDGYDWKIRVTLHSRVHNHRLSEDVFNQYSRVRVNLPDDVVGHVNQMLSHHSERRSIWHFVRDNADSELSMKDIHNLVARLARQNYSAPTLEGRIDKYLRDFCEDD